MAEQGVRHALAFATSPYGSYSSCRQYLDDIEAARAAVGPDAPVIDKIRHYHDHPGYVRPHADAVRAAWPISPMWTPTRCAWRSRPTRFPPQWMRAAVRTANTTSGQLHETARLVADDAGPGILWDLVWQSRSGPPHVPWLDPDINDHLEALAAAGVRGVVVSPIGFISDHLEVVWDLDHEAAATADRLGLRYVRAATPGTDARFVAMVRDLVLERLDPAMPRARLGQLPVWDTCPVGCCQS